MPGDTVAAQDLGQPPPTGSAATTLLRALPSPSPLLSPSSAQIQKVLLHGYTLYNLQPLLFILFFQHMFFCGAIHSWWWPLPRLSVLVIFPPKISTERDSGLSGSQVSVPTQPPVCHTSSPVVYTLNCEPQVLTPLF